MKNIQHTTIWEITENRQAVEATFYDEKGKATDVKWGFLDPQGKVAIDFVYQCVWKFENGLAKVKMNEKWGLIDIDGNAVVPLIYQSLQRINNLAQVQISGLWGFITERGEELIPCEYDYVFAPIGALFYVKRGGKYGIINSRNELIAEIIYDEISRNIRHNQVKVRIGKDWFEIDLSPHSLGL